MQERQQREKAIERQKNGIWADARRRIILDYQFLLSSRNTKLEKTGENMEKNLANKIKPCFFTTTIALPFSPALFKVITKVRPQIKQKSLSSYDIRSTYLPSNSAVWRDQKKVKTLPAEVLFHLISKILLSRICTGQRVGQMPSSDLSLVCFRSL